MAGGRYRCDSISHFLLSSLPSPVDQFTLSPTQQTKNKPNKLTNSLGKLSVYVSTCSPNHLLDIFEFQMIRAKKGRGERRKSTVCSYFLEGDGAGDAERRKHHLLVWIYFHLRGHCTQHQLIAYYPTGMIVLPAFGETNLIQMHTLLPSYHLSTLTQCSGIHIIKLVRLPRRLFMQALHMCTVGKQSFFQNNVKKVGRGVASAICTMA